MKHLELLLAVIVFNESVITAQSWSVTGNAATSSNFLGTTNAVGLTFKVNNQKAGSLDYSSLFGNSTFGYQNLLNNSGGKLNSAFGYRALFSNSFGSNNTAIGYNSLYSNSRGDNNTASGKFSLYSNTFGFSNVAIGIAALYKNTLGHNLVAIGDSALYNQVVGYVERDIDTGEPTGRVYYENTAIGSKSLFSNTSGFYNTATGFKALYLNTTGNDNTANGYLSLSANSTGSGNVAVGNYTLQNSKASSNTAIGTYAMNQNSSGVQNSTLGYDALSRNSSGSYNTAIGYRALARNTTQIRNTAVGWSAGDYHSSSSSTFIGHKASSTVDNVSNSMALGFLSTVTASYQVRIGSSTITSIGGQVGWSTLSDKRLKKNIKQNVPGLEFINKLIPLTYNLDVSAISKSMKENRGEDDEAILNKGIDKGIIDKEKIIYTGFGAQDVQKAATDIGYDFSGVDAPKNDKDFYGLRYAEFVVPLVKAVQELDAANKKLASELVELKQMLLDLKKDNNSNNESKASGYLLQNSPNPFNSSTIIRYYTPESSQSAKLLITNMKGQAMKAITINGGGKGQTTLSANALPSGTYNYSLWVAGKNIDTKQLSLIK